MNSSSKAKERTRKKEKNEPTESSLSTSNSCGLSTSNDIISQCCSSSFPAEQVVLPFLVSNPAKPQSNRNPTSASDLIFPTSSSAQTKPLPHPQCHHRATSRVYNLSMKKTFTVRFLKNDKNFIWFVDASDSGCAIDRFLHVTQRIHPNQPLQRTRLIMKVIMFGQYCL